MPNFLSSSTYRINEYPLSQLRETRNFYPVIPWDFPVFLFNISSSSSSVTIQNESYEIKTVNNFIKKLINSSKDLTPEVYEFVNENFWELL